MCFAIAQAHQKFINKKRVNNMFQVDKKYAYAIVGASNNTDKFGYKVLLDLLEAGFNAIPINPKREYIEDIKVYHFLRDVPQKIDVAIFIVPPIVTEKVLLEVKELGINKVWMQPGSSSEDAIKYCEENSIDCMHDVCVMIQKITT